ncbi:hypothetical protein, partial [Vibrio parahaemolyticus]|uniref:hypothetical protein n=1 Tax=Vibrio parahaemolyticus TaxID=670 RepID=UPI003C7BABBE
SIVYDTVNLMRTTFISEIGYLVSHNALLRGEARNTIVTALRLKHKNRRIIKMPRVLNPS